MFVDDVNTSATHRLNQIVHTLKHVHGFDLNLDESSDDQIETLSTSSELLKNSIVNESAFNSWYSNPDYAKHMLIIEATRLYLKEIAPRRRPRHLKEGTLHTVDNKAARVGRWLIDFAERASTTDDKMLKILNGFGRIGDDLINVGDQGRWQSVKDLIADYESRANNELNDEDDRQLAKDNIHVMRVGFKLYDKHHSNREPVEVDLLSTDKVDEMSMGDVDSTSEFASKFPDLVNMAQKYGVDISDADVEEGNEFSGALASARAAHKDSFTVGGKTYQVHESVKSKLSENHMQHHDYQASMARSELYRNAKYAMDMLKMIHPEDDVEPWIAANLTKDAMYLDKIFHYLDYYTKFEPEQLPSAEQPDLSALDEDSDELEDTTGTIARQNLIQIFEYSVKLFHMIQPGDKLEGWVAMKLTTASEGISSAKHYLDYKNFERHAADRFSLEESRKYGLKEEISKRDFKLVADLIKKHPDPIARHHMAKHHAEVFAKTNPKFNRGMFFAAANAKEHQKDADMSQFAGSKKKTVKEALDSADQDLQQAETLIAAKSISDDLQSMAEKIARMGVDELMPLVDTMKSQFGPEAADAYNEVMKAQLDTLLAATQEAKEQSDNAVLAIQNGGIPGAGTTDIENVPAVAGPGKEPEIEEPEGFGTTPAAAGGEEPLGRAKKPVPGEELAEGRKRLGEKWGTEMKTAEKDKGKWDGWTLAKLRARRKSLMDKETRTAAEQKEVKQIDFAIRAKQKDKFGDVKKEGVEEAKKAKPDFLDMDKDGNKKESMKKAVADKAKAKKMEEAKKAKPDFLDMDKDGNKKESMKKAVADKAKAKKVAEAKKEKNPYAIGMWQAKKEAGLDPNKPAKDLPKKLITRGHKIARGIEKVDESISRLNTLLLRAEKGKKILEGQLADHRAEFTRMVVEGRTKDVLAHGQGLEGDIIEKKIMEMQKMIKGLENKISSINAESNRRMQAVVEQEQKAYRFAQIKATTPWGVIVESANGAKNYKFFKDQQARDYWVQLNDVKNAKLIGPEHFDIAASK